MKVTALILLALFALSTASDRSIIARRTEEEVPRAWKIIQRADLKEQISFTIYLHPSNLDLLHQTFKAVSDPKSEQWGQFLTKAELDDMIRAPSNVFEEYEEWLSQFDVEYKFNAATIKVKTTVGVASKMFQVKFDHYRHTNGKEVTKLTGEASVPSNLAKYTKFVAGLSELFSEGIHGHHYMPRHRTSTNVEATNLVITPSILKSYYGVPSNALATNENNYQGIAAFDDYFSIGALQQFDTTENIPYPNVTREGPDCFPKCDQYESDLDIQYVTAMGEGVNTLFLVQGVNYWIMQWAEEALELNPYPLVWSISYGYSELDQCEIAVTNCNSLGYNSQEYIQATNIYLQQFATLGVSVLVSDGDDGACNLGGATGNCPIDNSNYCPLGGCAHNTTQCGMFTVKDTSSGELCFYPMGLGSDACASVLSNTLYANLAINAFLTANKACGAAIEDDSERDPHFYSSCTCSQLKTTTNYGLQVSGYQYVESNGALFTPDFPTSSPYVTSVGATQFITNSNNVVTSEVVCSILTGAIITTGGGFSLYQTAEDYQTQAVSAWASNASNHLPPSYSYDINNRAYPDVSFNGHNYLIYYSQSTSDSCPCASGEVDGTSCSSPALAGMISLINDQLLNAGKPQLGFLNYLLYQMAEAQPSAFNDIISGNNNCNRAWCCQYGYSAVPGWDPASGLGSPNYQPFLDYVLSAKGL